MIKVVILLTMYLMIVDYLPRSERKVIGPRAPCVAVADEAEAGGRRNRAGDAARTTTTVSQRDVYH